MTTHIFNQYNQAISEGKNLAIIFRYAAKCGGVKRIAVDQLTGNHYGALVNVWFANGYRACTNFVDYSHALDWAQSKQQRKGTWWTDCIVEHS